MANRYFFRVPITGYCVVDVEADSQDEAEEKVLSECELKHVEEWEPTRAIVTGNVFHGKQNEMDIDGAEDEDGNDIDTAPCKTQYRMMSGEWV